MNKAKGGECRLSLCSYMSVGMLRDVRGRNIPVVPHYPQKRFIYSVPVINVLKLLPNTQ